MTSAPTFLDKSTIDALDVYDIIWTHLFFD
jgi:hypothetical protein